MFYGIWKYSPISISRSSHERGKEKGPRLPTAGRLFARLMAERARVCRHRDLNSEHQTGNVFGCFSVTGLAFLVATKKMRHPAPQPPAPWRTHCWAARQRRKWVTEEGRRLAWGIPKHSLPEEPRLVVRRANREAGQVPDPPGAVARGPGVLQAGPGGREEAGLPPGLRRGPGLPSVVLGARGAMTQRHGPPYVPGEFLCQADGETYLAWSWE